MFTELLQNEISNARKKNINHLFENYMDENYQLKISNYCKKFGLAPEDINDKLKNKDCFVASVFAKDPLKQNITEMLVETILKSSKLPAGGKNCIRFDEAGNTTTEKGNNISKSADFYIDRVYYTQKYTNENGGAQDNQFADVEQFLRNGSKTTKVGAILDGEYWNSKRENLKKDFDKNPNVKITSVDELYKEMNEN